MDIYVEVFKGDFLKMDISWKYQNNVLILLREHIKSIL